MTTAEALTFAKTLDHPDIFGNARILDRILTALETVCTAKQRKEALAILCANAEHFRRGDTPGHETWYHDHLQAAARAAGRWTT